MEKDITAQKSVRQKQNDSLDVSDTKTKKSKIDDVFKGFNTKIDHNEKRTMAIMIKHAIDDTYDRIKEYLSSLIKTAQNFNSFQRVKRSIAIGTVLVGGLFNPISTPNNLTDTRGYLRTQQTYQVGVNGIKRINEYGQLGLIYKSDTQTLNYQVIAKPLKNSEYSQNNGNYIAYELNGLTNNGRWYQCALQYRGHNKYYMIYMIWGGHNEGPGKIVAFNGNVNNGDKIDIKMNIRDHKIYMELQDLNTGAIAKKSFSENANFFVGKKLVHGFYTGLMTEFNDYVKRVNMNLVPSNNYHYLSGGLASFSGVFEYFSVSTDKHMHDIQIKNKKPIEYYAKTIKLVNLFEKIPRIDGKYGDGRTSFELNLKYFEIKSNGKTIYITQKNDQNK